MRDDEILSGLDFATTEEIEVPEEHAHRVQDLIEFREALSEQMGRLSDDDETLAQSLAWRGNWEQFQATAREAGFNEQQAVALAIMIMTPRDMGFQLLALSKGSQPFEIVCQALIAAMA